MPGYLSLGEGVNRIKRRYTVYKINDSVFIYTTSDAGDGGVLFACEASAVDRNVLVQLAFCTTGANLITDGWRLEFGAEKYLLQRPGSRSSYLCGCCRSDEARGACVRRQYLNKLQGAKSTSSIKVKRDVSHWSRMGEHFFFFSDRLNHII